jgi:polyprenyl P-hydroxybenzoate and phenylacrylic acid decarboxylases
MSDKIRLVIGISGASGAPLAVALLQTLSENPQIETHLVISGNARITIEHETKLSVSEVEKMADFVHEINDMGAKISSGTFKTNGMIIVPCSMKTLAAINNGYSDNLIHRAADVTLKERRKLLLVTRETPLSTIHLRNMYELSQMGVIIMPPMISYYNLPKTIYDSTNQMIGKILDSFDIEYRHFKSWGGMPVKL